MFIYAAQNSLQTDFTNLQNAHQNFNNLFTQYNAQINNLNTNRKSNTIINTLSIIMGIMIFMILIGGIYLLVVNKDNLQKINIIFPISLVIFLLAFLGVLIYAISNQKDFIDSNIENQLTNTEAINLYDNTIALQNNVTNNFHAQLLKGCQSNYIYQIEYARVLVQYIDTILQIATDLKIPNVNTAATIHLGDDLFQIYNLLSPTPNYYNSSNIYNALTKNNLIPDVGVLKSTIEFLFSFLTNFNTSLTLLPLNRTGIDSDLGYLNTMIADMNQSTQNLKTNIDNSIIDNIAAAYRVTQLGITAKKLMPELNSTFNFFNLMIPKYQKDSAGYLLSIKQVLSSMVKETITNAGVQTFFSLFKEMLVSLNFDSTHSYSSLSNNTNIVSTSESTVNNVNTFVYNIANQISTIANNIENIGGFIGNYTFSDLLILIQACDDILNLFNANPMFASITDITIFFNNNKVNYQNLINKLTQITNLINNQDCGAIANTADKALYLYNCKNNLISNISNIISGGITNLPDITVQSGLLIQTIINQGYINNASTVNDLKQFLLKLDIDPLITKAQELTGSTVTDLLTLSAFLDSIIAGLDISISLNEGNITSTCPSYFVSTLTGPGCPTNNNLGVYNRTANDFVNYIYLIKVLYTKLLQYSQTGYKTRISKYIATIPTTNMLSLSVWSTLNTNLTQFNNNLASKFIPLSSTNKSQFFTQIIAIIKQQLQDFLYLSAFSMEFNPIPESSFLSLSSSNILTSIDSINLPGYSTGTVTYLGTRLSNYIDTIQDASANAYDVILSYFGTYFLDYRAFLVFLSGHKWSLLPSSIIPSSNVVKSLIGSIDDTNSIQT